MIVMDKEERDDREVEKKRKTNTNISYPKWFFSSVSRRGVST
jgi:hypothetical protein